MKILGGLGKTGTTSLDRALRDLGLRSVHYPASLDLLAEHDAATDTPVFQPGWLEEVDRRWGCRFIFTVRDMDSWLDSCRRHYSRESTELRSVDAEHTRHLLAVRRAVFGAEFFEEGRWRRAYEQHLAAVRSFFSSRPDDLLLLDIFAGEGWEPLCVFLGVPTPVGAPFPHLNRSTDLAGDQ